MSTAQAHANAGVTRYARKVPDAFPAGWARIPNNPLVAAAVAALLKGGPKARTLLGGWSLERDGRLVYRHIGRKGGEIDIYVQGDAAAGALSPEEQWELVSAFRPLTVDVLIMVMAQLCEPSLRSKPMYPTLSPTLVTANAMLRYKRINRWGVERAQCRERISAAIRRLQMLRFDVRRYPAWDVAIRRWNPRGVGVTGDRLFEIVDADEVCYPASDDRAMDEAWLIRPGHWARWWLNAQGTVWTSPMSRSLLALDHRSNRGVDVLAKKVGLNMSLLWGAVRSRYRFERRINHLLEDVGELPVPVERGGHWAGRLRDRFDEALLRLQEHSIFEEVEWPDGHGPGSLDRSKGWVDHWLASSVHIHRPGGPPDTGELPPPPSKPRRYRRKQLAPVAPAVTGADIRMLRAERRLSQLTFARELGISPSYLSQVENGRRGVNPDLLGRVERWSVAAE